MTPIAIADLGAGLDAALDAAGVTGLWSSMAPQLLVAAGRVTTATADLRLFRRDADLGRWVPSAVPAVTVDPGVNAGVFELRFVTAEIAGQYALVKVNGTGTVAYFFRPGRA